MSDQTIAPEPQSAEAGAETAWQLLDDVNPATAEFPALTRVGDERILVFKIGDGFRGVERSCPHQQRSLHDAFLLQAAMFTPLYPSDLYHAILSTPGVDHFTMTAPAAAITPTGSQLPVLGTLTVS